MRAVRRIAALALVPALLLVSTLAQAAPAYIEHDVPAARLAGSGSFTYFTLKIYSAELWVGPRGYSLAAPFALDLRYVRNLNGGKIAEASAEQMEKIDAGSPAERKAWLQKMTAIFPDVHEGSHITGVFVPDEGARFYLDGKPLATIADVGFAAAFFGIWLDPKTTAPALRAALLKQAAPLVARPQ
jgi:hypothetical protein